MTRPYSYKEHLETMDRQKLIDTILEYENSIVWNTTCLNCASLLDHNYEQYVRLERMSDLIEELDEDEYFVPVWKVKAILKGKLV